MWSKYSPGRTDNLLCRLPRPASPGLLSGRSRRHPGVDPDMTTIGDYWTGLGQNHLHEVLEPVQYPLISLTLLHDCMFCILSSHTMFICSTLISYNMFIITKHSFARLLSISPADRPSRVESRVDCFLQPPGWKASAEPVPLPINYYQYNNIWK